MSAKVGSSQPMQARPSGNEKVSLTPERAKGMSFFGKIAYLWNYVALSTDSQAFFILLILFLIAEVVLGILIITKVNYTEIDWIAYMQEVKGVMDGQMDYSKLRGDTGPLVYPAGFVYIYSALYVLTDDGENVLRAQWIFLGLYLLTTAAAAILLHRTQMVPNWAIALICLSKRVHSIYMLRCFNDGIAMLLLFLSIMYFIRDKWKMGSLVFSLAVSVKMNILLFAPGLLLLMLRRLALRGTIVCLSICASLQVLLALPFLLTYPYSYLKGAFDFGRVFTYVWTVNFKFLPEDIFVSKTLGKGLLVLQLLLLAVFFIKREASKGGLLQLFKNALQGKAMAENLSARWIVGSMFLSNFIGIVCARSLHFQFYVWYFHSLPFLLWATSLDTRIRLLVLFLIERVWNVFPSTPESSLTLQAMHLLILGALFVSPTLNADTITSKTRSAAAVAEGSSNQDKGKKRD